MKKYLKIAALILTFAVVMTLTACGGDGKSSGGFLTVEQMPETWSAKSGGYTCEGTERQSYLVATNETEHKPFVYEADLTFTDPKDGSGALVFQATADAKNCYQATLDARSRKAELTKLENGNQISLGTAVRVEEADVYHLSVTMVDEHIAFYVGDELVCSTADYVLSPDLGQNDAYLSGRLGLYAGKGDPVTFTNVSYTALDASPALTKLAVTPASGTAEGGDNLLIDGQYVYQEYVSNDCSQATITAEAPEGVEVEVVDAQGKTVTGPVDIPENTITKLQVHTYTTDSEGNRLNRLSYRLHIHRRQASYYDEPYRDQYHYSVQEGWGNDPNGLVKLGDTYHMFYQFYPENTDWGAMHWGHATSTDLVHWEHEGIAFYPNEYGTMFSGCAVADVNNDSGLFDENGGIVLIITANGNGQRMIAAYSSDGENWQYYHETDANGVRTGNDVLIDWTEDELKDAAFRDPKVFKYEDTYFMVIAGGPLRIYSSQDLLHWTCESTYGNTKKNSSSLEVMTECPDLFRVPVEGEGGYKWVLDYGGHFYQVGDFNNSSGKWEFYPDADWPEAVPMNFGNDFYATMTYYQGSSFNEDTQDPVISCSWLNSWDYCNLYDDMSQNKLFNGTYSMSLELSLVRGTDGKLVLKQRPVDEYANSVFGGEAAFSGTVTTEAGVSQDIEGFSGDAYLMELTAHPGEGTTKVGALVCAGSGEGYKVEYDLATDTLLVDRGRASNQFSSIQFSSHVTEEREDGSVTIHIYVDRTTLDVYSRDYTASCTVLVLPEESDRGAAVYSEGGACDFDVTITPAESIW